MALAMKKVHLEEMIAHAKEAFPNEACGILAGKGKSVAKVYRMANAERSGERYFMDSGEQFQVTKRMREEALDMVGIYHSHPNAKPYPSSSDIELAFYPEASYVIVSIMRGAPEIRSFRIAEGVVAEEEITIEPGEDR